MCCAPSAAAEPTPAARAATGAAVRLAVRPCAEELPADASSIRDALSSVSWTANIGLALFKASPTSCSTRKTRSARLRGKSLHCRSGGLPAYDVRSFRSICCLQRDQTPKRRAVVMCAATSCFPEWPTRAHRSARTMDAAGSQMATFASQSTRSRAPQRRFRLWCAGGV